MNVVIPFHPGDQAQAVRLLSWIAELGKVEATVFLMCREECNAAELMIKLALEGFTAQAWIQDYEKVTSDWSTGDRTKPRSAAGANSLFRQTAWHMYVKKLGPWLWLEPDAIPTSKNWFAEIRDEYESARKPFMGMKVIGNHPQGNMSGVGVYPQNTPELMEGAMMASHIPFDVAKPMDVVPHCHFTTRIVHEFNAPTFGSMEDFNARVPAGTSIYHSCKDGSIFPFLEQRLFSTDALPGSVEPSLPYSGGEGPAGSTPARVSEFLESRGWKKYRYGFWDKNGMKMSEAGAIEFERLNGPAEDHCIDALAERFNADTGKTRNGEGTNQPEAEAGDPLPMAPLRAEGSNPSLVTITRLLAPQTRIEQVRALVEALNSLANSKHSRTTVLEELKRVKLIPSKLRRR